MKIFSQKVLRPGKGVYIWVGGREFCSRNGEHKKIVPNVATLVKRKLFSKAGASVRTRFYRNIERCV
jgi:hypothetical protein